jgi:hypothetical protein
MQLVNYQTRYGDWRELFRSVDRIEKVTKADIRRVANETFTDTNRTVGVIETTGAGQGTDTDKETQDQSRSDPAIPDRVATQRGGAQ